jgi:hypothetical protein
MFHDRHMLSRIEKYLAHLDQLSGGVEPGFHRIPTSRENQKSVTVMAYENLPDDLATALTYGLSLATHPEWKLGSPELCISVRSKDLSWAMAVGYLADQLRGNCPFHYGDTINFGEPIAKQSKMTAFVVFAPAVLDAEDCRIDVSLPGHEGHDIINITGMYPIHEVERQYIQANGLEAFWDTDWDMYDVRRKPSV